MNRSKKLASLFEQDQEDRDTEKEDEEKKKEKKDQEKKDKEKEKEKAPEKEDDGKNDKWLKSDEAKEGKKEWFVILDGEDDSYYLAKKKDISKKDEVVHGPLDLFKAETMLALEISRSE